MAACEGSGKAAAPRVAELEPQAEPTELGLGDGSGEEAIPTRTVQAEAVQPGADEADEHEHAPPDWDDAEQARVEAEWEAQQAAERRAAQAKKAKRKKVSCEHSICVTPVQRWNRIVCDGQLTVDEHVGPYVFEEYMAEVCHPQRTFMAAPDYVRAARIELKAKRSRQAPDWTP
jgi:hypothetical protein